MSSISGPGKGKLHTNLALWDQVGTRKNATSDTATVSMPSRMKILKALVGIYSMSKRGHKLTRPIHDARQCRPSSLRRRRGFLITR